VVRGSYEHEAGMTTTIIARRKVLAYNGRNFVFLMMLDIVSNLIYSGPRHLFARLIFSRHRLSLWDLLGIPEQMDRNVALGCQPVQGFPVDNFRERNHEWWHFAMTYRYLVTFYCDRDGISPKHGDDTIERYGPFLRHECLSRFFSWEIPDPREWEPLIEPVR